MPKSWKIANLLVIEWSNIDNVHYQVEVGVGLHGFGSLHRPNFSEVLF